MDIVDVADVADSVSRFGDRYLRRVYTTRELDACASGTDARRLAAHFAAKEAALKSLPIGDGAIDWRSVEILLPATGEAAVALSGEAAEAARRAGIVTLAVSVSTTRHHAAAVVVAEGSDPSEKG
jgi:holo-[acyl-carrier protein] synthase